MTFRWDCGGKSDPARIQLRMVLLYTVDVSMALTVFWGLARWDHCSEKPECQQENLPEVGQPR